MTLLLGRAVWRRGADAWRHETLEPGHDIAVRAPGLMAEGVCASHGRGACVVFEPEAMCHQVVETPRVKRAVFASLARVRNEHPVVASENLGWGFEQPEPGPGGAYFTLLSYEATPGLIDLVQACSGAGMRLSSAWSAYSVAAALADQRPGARTGTVLIMVPDFTAVACCEGRRSFRAWSGAMTERDWKAFGALAGEGDSRTGRGVSGGVQRKPRILVVAEAGVERCWPAWEELRSSGRIEAIAGLDEFAGAALRMSPAHPANLAEAFPRPAQLDPVLVPAAVACTLSALALAVAFGLGSRGLKANREAAAQVISRLDSRLAELNANKLEMDRLRLELREDDWASVSPGNAALRELTLAVPDALTLTSFSIGRDGRFDLGAIVTAPGFDPASARRDLSARGFAASADADWSYDPGAGRLAVRGTFKEPLR